MLWRSAKVSLGSLGSSAGNLPSGKLRRRASRQCGRAAKVGSRDIDRLLKTIRHRPRAGRNIQNYMRLGGFRVNEAVEFVEHVGGESVAALHDNLGAAGRGHDLLGVNRISMASCAIP